MGGQIRIHQREKRFCHLCSDNFSFSVFNRSTWSFAANNTCVFSSSHFCSLKTFTTRKNIWRNVYESSLSSFTCEKDSHIRWTRGGFMGRLLDSQLNNDLPFFSFSQFVSFCFMARMNHLKFRAQFNHLQKWEKSLNTQRKTAKWGLSVRYLRRTSSLPAWSKTSEFAASTGCSKINTHTYMIHMIIYIQTRD